jgi:hypothetical protein
MLTRRRLWDMVEKLYGVRFPLTWAEYLQFETTVLTWEAKFREKGLLLDNPITY